MHCRLIGPLDTRLLLNSVRQYLSGGYAVTCEPP